jgi:hypothetical protein
VSFKDLFWKFLTRIKAPVSGTSPVAEVGQLLFMVAGPSSATKAIAPFVKGVMGSRSDSTWRGCFEVQFVENIRLCSEV